MAPLHRDVQLRCYGDESTPCGWLLGCAATRLAAGALLRPKSVSDLAPISAFAPHSLVCLHQDGVLEQVMDYPAIHTLMGRYDLLPEKAPACQKVWDFLGDAEQDVSRPATIAAPDEPPHWSPAPIDRAPEDRDAMLC